MVRHRVSPMMKRAAGLLGWLLAAWSTGCGGDDDACQTPGTGVASGDLSGWSDDVMRTDYTVTEDLEQPAYVVNLDTGPGTCGQASDSGDHLLLIWLNAPPTEGGYQIGSAGSPFALFENDGPADENIATSGTVVIESMSADCVGGSFDLEFPGETLNGHLVGSFAASVCE